MNTLSVKNFTALAACCLTGLSLFGQNPLSQQTQVEVGIGIISPILQSGEELMRAKDLRDAELSYYENTSGVRRAVGKYSNLLGYNFTFAFHKPIKRVKGLMIGAVVRNSQTGSTPDEGYAEAYFFNFITAGISFKYYPFEKYNVFTRADFGIAGVFTKNRFINEDDEQNLFHQFGIGYGASLGLGYSLTPFKNKTKSLDAMIIYQQLGTRVEVNGIGDDQWKFGAVNFIVAYSF
jgi:hypothetical protein